MIEGYAAVFYNGTPETEYTLGQSSGLTYVERIGRGAFDRALQSDDVLALYNHNHHLGILGRSSANTLDLAVDEKGLRYRITDGNTQLHRDVAEMQSRGDLRGSSFGFSQHKQTTERSGDQVIITVNDLRLHDVGPVAEPAYSGTNEGGRSIRCVTSAGIVLPAYEFSPIESRARIQYSAVQLRLKELG